MRRSFAVALVWMLVLAVVICGASFAGAADDLTMYAYRHDPHELGKKGLWGVMLRFNNPVFPSEVAKATKVTVEGVQKKFDLLEPDSREKAISASASLLLVPTEGSDRPVSITLTVSKGLTDAAGRRILAKDFTYQLRSFEIVSVGSITTFYQSRKEKGLRVWLSSPVSDRDLATAIAIYPAVEKLNVTREGGRVYLISGQFEFNKDYVLKISPKAVSQGAAILEEKEFPFKGPGVKPEIAVKSDRSVVELKSRQLLPLRLANVAKVRCRIVKAPPLLASEVSDALATEEGSKKFNIKNKIAEFKRLAETGKLNPLFVGQASEDAEAFMAQGGGEKDYSYSLPLSFRKNPEQGGAWIVTLSDPDYGRAALTKSSFRSPTCQ